METIAEFYPPLPSRDPIPSYYLPTTFLLSLIPFFTPNRRRTALLILPILLSLCLSSPRYTFGIPSADFYRSSAFIITPLWFIEFAICRPQKGGDAPVYLGKSGAPKGVEDCKSVWEKIWWVGQLMVPSHRGVGWNWQIKNIPVDEKAHLPRGRWIANQAVKAAVAYLSSLGLLAVLGFASALERQEGHGVLTSRLVDAVIGWAGAIWIYCRLCSFYCSASAVTVAIGVYEVWQLPPLMGHLRDAWSVRQFWAVYHQTMRQMVSAPALRITRALGFRRGSLASGLCQVYIAFGFSTLVHQFQMFNVTRRDMGEFAFFMSQPVVISLEGVVIWFWRRYARPSKNASSAEVMVGYVWVFLWFSFSLPIYLKGSRDAGIVRDAFFGTAPFDFGNSLAKMAHL